MKKATWTRELPLEGSGTRLNLHPLHQLLWNPLSPAKAYGLAAVIAISFIFYLFPVSFLAGHGWFFENGDASQHVSGWLFYARDAWHFPLLKTERLNYPEGVSIAFTDSIPLAALIAKLFAGQLPPSFHYIGLWHAVSFFTQAISAVFLMRALDVRHTLGTTAAVLFALTWPALLWRLGHPSLMTHGIILASLALYFLGRHGTWRPNVVAAALIGMCLVGLTVHPYFLAFTYALFLAFLLDQTVVSGEPVKTQALRLIASVVVLIGAGFILGYFGKGTTTFGYDYYSMNLGAPFCGSRFYSCVVQSKEQPFSPFHFYDATGGQYEGFNYFGLGLFLLLPFAVATGRTAIGSFPKRHPFLLLALIACFFYAVSNKAFLGPLELYAVDLPEFTDRLTGTFRASGRFFWIIGYFILFATLATLLRKPSKYAALLLVAALPLQWMDVKPLRDNIRQTATRTAKDDLQPWAKAMRDIDRINLFPAFGCNETEIKLYWFFQRAAAHYEKLINTGYIARPSTVCPENRQFFEQAFAPRQLYILAAKDVANPFAIPAGFRKALAQGECVKWDYAVVCQAGTGPDHWKNTDLPTAQIESYRADRAYWSAADLPTVVGAVKEDRLELRPGAQAGFLSFGPYITLPPGRYRVTIAYASDAPPGQQTGNWDVTTGNGSSKPEDVRTFASGALHGTNGERDTRSADITVDRLVSHVEVRNFYTGSGDLKIFSIALEEIK